MDTIERETYRLHLRAAVFEMIFTQTMWSAVDVAAKNMDAGPFEVTIITMAPGAVLLISLFLAGFMERGTRAHLFLWPAILGRLPLLLLFFFASPWMFIALLVLQSFALMPITAALNSVVRSNYADHSRGRLYGRASQFGHLASGLFVLGFGILLDDSPTAYRYVYPLVAIFGVVSCVLFMRMPQRPNSNDTVTAAKTDPFYAIRVLRGDRLFRLYQLGFFVYGLAFMISVTAKPLFAANTLQLSNKEMLGARALSSLMLVLFTPLMGRLLDRVNPAGLASICYPILAVTTGLLFTVNSGWAYLLCEGVFAFGMAGVFIAWNLGPVTLAEEGTAARYMGVHVALVGIRAIIGHPVGGYIASIDPRVAFPISFLLFLVAATIMWRIRRPIEERMQARREAAATSTTATTMSSEELFATTLPETPDPGYESRSGPGDAPDAPPSPTTTSPPRT